MEVELQGARAGTGFSFLILVTFGWKDWVGGHFSHGDFTRSTNVYGARKAGLSSLRVVDAMNPPKTTVLGIRLDPERRGWIEAEAARQGVSIRTYFERMIDEARSGGEDLEEPAQPIAGKPVLDAGSEIHDGTAAPASETWSVGGTDSIREPLPEASAESPGLSDDLVSSFGRMIDESRSGGQERVEPGLSADLVSSLERMIDEARSSGEDQVEHGEPIEREPVLDAVSDIHDHTAALPMKAWSAGRTDSIPEPRLGASAVSTTAPRGLCDDVVSVATIPCRMIRGALGRSRALINAVTRPFRRNRAF